MVDTRVESHQAIHDALRTMGDGDFAEQAPRLLGVLGYRSERTLPGQSGRPADLLGNTADTAEKRAFLEAATAALVLFQVTDQEIKGAGPQQRLIRDNSFDADSNAKSFLFTAVELNGDGYSRGRYAAFTREINKCFPAIPAVVLFRTSSGRVTLAFVHRRENKRNPGRDVLGSVSLIREVKTDDPHRAHVDILAELALAKRLRWMDTHDKSRNFDGLLAAWLAALDTEELNRSFYRALKGWFDRAVREARFPTAGPRVLPPEEHVIRLITRLLFVWFIKEKDLVSDKPFVEAQVQALLKDYDAANGDSYYRAVLQNLFFATLNTEIGMREFSKESRETVRNFSRYRYRKEMRDPDALVAFFAETPFINGGLFDCLDSEEAAGQGGYRIDCFSDNPNERLGYSIPNRLFFDNGGLITLFDRYKFTVEENTPAEQEVALDPELLGKVFENLLAAYNPETRESARKQTGSYYTPRAVVDYMVDEALVASLAERAQPDDGNIDLWQEMLHYLLDYNDAGELFSETEAERIIRAIAELRVLDPAAGSGAFPMGVLHKLTLALRRLDPYNSRWRALQEEIAGKRAALTFHTDDQQERDKALADISATFEHYQNSDFGRKLYLIQNSIYGVDIQPVACQIAKLRFFISLAIEQTPDPNAANFGIHPLPNLETRFVAANTLLGLGGLNRELVSTRTEELQLELNANRERHYHAATRGRKLEYRSRDKELRVDLAQSLADAGLQADHANRVADWDPFDQNAHADWFDPEYMFGVTGGFDIVIGNPPYVESRNSLMTEDSKEAYRNQARIDWRGELPRGSDLLIYFLARSARLLHDRGQACLITQNAWLSTDYGKVFQSFSLGRFSFERIIDTSAKFFSDVQGPNINAVITIFSRRGTANLEYAVANEDMEITATRVIPARQEMKWGHLLAMPEFFEHILADITSKESPDLGRGVRFGQGINVKKDVLNVPGATVPVILKGTEFVAAAADGAVRTSVLNPKRIGNIPALILPRGIGDRHYCTFNYCRGLSLSGVELYLPDRLWESDRHYCLWVYLNSSFVWLFREITGRKNLGGGMLKAEATDMKDLPFRFNFDFGREARELFNSLRQREPLPVAKELFTEEHLHIDNLIANHLGFTEWLDPIRETLLAQVKARGSMAQFRR